MIVIRDMLAELVKEGFPKELLSWRLKGKKGTAFQTVGNRQKK